MCMFGVHLSLPYRISKCVQNLIVKNVIHGGMDDTK